MLRKGGRLALSSWSPDTFRLMGSSFALLKPYWPAGQPFPFALEPRLIDPQGLAAMATEAGFVEAAVTLHDPGITFAGAEGYWDWMGSTGSRAIIDTLQHLVGPEALQGFKAEFFAALRPLEQPDGLHVPSGAVYLTASKPAE